LQRALCNPGLPTPIVRLNPAASDTTPEDSMKGSYATLIALFLSAFSIPALAANVEVWNPPMNNTAGRFQLLPAYNNEAVLDNETGLHWERSPDATPRNWGAANFHCNHDKTIGNRKGWRLPTAQELASLIDPSVPRPGPTLPDGHPFMNVQGNDYWSATQQEHGFNANAWLVSFLDTFVITIPKSIPLLVWCVRGGQGTDFQ
jgi:hypothetical protein